MASPETNRIGGARPSGAGGVKNLLAMFEKSSSSPSGSPAAGNSTGPANPVSRDQSPGPRPLARVRTSFVAVTGNQMLGLQKVPVPSSPMSPVVPIAESAKPADEVMDKEMIASEKELKKATANGKHILDESNLKKHDLETQYTTPSKSSFTLGGSRLSPDAEKPEETTLQEPPNSITMKDEEEEEPVKPVKVESKPKPTTTKVGPAPKSPIKSTFSSGKGNKVASAKSGKNLTLPPSKSNTTSPLPSPALPPKSPVRSTNTAPGSGTRTKPPTVTQGMASSSSRPRTAVPTTATTISTAPKPRQPTVTTEKAKVPVVKKSEVKPAREPTKPPTIRSSAFAPTAASAAKLAADQKAAAARSRPPSSASVRNRSPPGSTGMRRGNSGLSSRPGRKDQRSPQRPQTSAAIRNPNRTSVGSLAGVSGATGGDFLSRMMRPTTASAGKVSDKKPGAMNPPPKRSASVTSTSRRRETSLPPSTSRIQKQKTGDQSKVDEGENTEATQQPEEIPAENIEVKEEPRELNLVAAEAVNPTAPTEIEAEAQESEDGSQSPTTTTSSTTLVQEGESKDDSEVLAKD